MKKVALGLKKLGNVQRGVAQQRCSSSFSGMTKRGTNCNQLVEGQFKVGTAGGLEHSDLVLLSEMLQGSSRLVSHGSGLRQHA